MASLLVGRKVVVLAENLYEDLELWYPTLRLREEGAEVVIAGAGDPEYKGKHGYPVTVDAQVPTIVPAEFDAIVIPGGYAPDYMRRRPEVLDLVRSMFAADKLVAAICHAAWVLVSAGIAEGRTMTCYHSIKDDVVNAGATYVDREVVRDGNLITSRQPSDLGVFCREIIDSLSEGGERKVKAHSAGGREAFSDQHSGREPMNATDT